MPDLLPLLGSALILGLLGGGHCLGMCGGLMGALTLAIPAEQRGRRLQLLLAYNLGRILSYAAAGLLLGLAGWAIASTPFASALRAITQPSLFDSTTTGRPFKSGRNTVSHEA